MHMGIESHVFGQTCDLSLARVFINTMLSSEIVFKKHIPWWDGKTGISAPNVGDCFF